MLLFVDSEHLLMVHTEAFAFQENLYLAIPIPTVGFGQLFDSVSEIQIILS